LAQLFEEPPTDALHLLKSKSIPLRKKFYSLPFFLVRSSLTNQLFFYVYRERRSVMSVVLSNEATDCLFEFLKCARFCPDHFIA
jgi:hypothetical protein